MDDNYDDARLKDRDHLPRCGWDHSILARLLEKLVMASQDIGTVLRYGLEGPGVADDARCYSQVRSLTTSNCVVSQNGHLYTSTC